MDQENLASAAYSPNHIVLHGASWDRDVTIGDALLDHPVLMNYDRGVLEITTRSFRHQVGKSLLVSFITFLTMELQQNICNGGSTTVRVKAIEVGLEPDHGFWIQNEMAMRGKEDFDPECVPLPDLILEADISNTILNRLSILARLKAPEVWCLKGKSIEVLLLNANGDYDLSAQSRVFPFLPVKELSRFLHMTPNEGELQILQAFVTWVRQQRSSWGV